mgnify:CR=1 FL=1
MPALRAARISRSRASVAKKLRAFAYVPTIADTVEAALAYRENFSSRELMPIHGDWTAWDTAANASIKLDACLKAAAMRALIDKGWVKMQNFSQSKNKFGYIYVLTPSGIAQKAALTGRFLQRKMHEFEALKAEIELLQSETAQTSANQPQST